MKTKRNNRAMHTRVLALSTTLYGAVIMLYRRLKELGPRLLKVGLVAVLGGGIAYLFERQLIDWLIAPARSQLTTYAESGSFNMPAAVYIASGLVLALPFAAYHCLAAVKTLFARDSKFYFWSLAFMSGVLALAGLYVGYSYGLPKMLQFTSLQFLPDAANPLASTYGYLQYYSAYLAIWAISAQIPLVMYIVNQLQSRPVKTLLGYERTVIPVSLVGAVIISHSSDILVLLATALPIVLMYQAGIAVTYLYNHSGQYRRMIVGGVSQVDKAVQSEKIEILESALLSPWLEPVPVAEAEDSVGLPRVIPARPQAQAQAQQIVLQPISGPAREQASEQSQPYQPRHVTEVSVLAKDPQADSKTSGKPIISKKPAVVNGIRRRLY